MLIQNHVKMLDLGNSVWYRPSAVSVSDRRLVITVNEGDLYNLADAYRYQAHAGFLQLSAGAGELCRFVKRWGPLFLVRGTELPRSIGYFHPPLDDIETYWLFQRYLRAKLDMLHAFEKHW